mmetsp:Transcript_33672/g.38756  ORF Transcript_33672/g.38756 Transcript_33672/m.38756 type:complete len:109 (+) Transcript_33672:111-437(+)
MLLFGLWKGIVVTAGVYFLCRTALDWAGYEIVPGNDVMSTVEVHKHNVRNCGAYLKMGKIKTEELREKYFHAKGIKKFRRLRQIWIKKLGFWIFKDVDSDVAKAQVQK